MDITYYLTYDLPVEYKGLKLYPVTVRDYLMFSNYSSFFAIDKNSIPDAKVIAMTELEYIFYLTMNDPLNTPVIFMFDRLLSLCLKDDKSFEDIQQSIKRFDYDSNQKPFFKINEQTYNSADYDNIKNIISLQNDIDLIDENISKEVRDSLDKARIYKNKLSSSKIASYEDYIISLSVATGWTLDYIYSMTIRKFTKSIRRLDNMMHYKIYLAASMSGMYDFKDKSFIKHWLTNLDDEGKYNDVSIDLNAMQNKISLESAK